MKIVSSSEAQLNVKARETAEETRERITRVAEDLFRRMGFAKTAVADIAAELGMSPANVYRFFPSKTAIVATICQRCLSEIDREMAAIAAGPGTPQARIAGIYLAILRYHKANFLAERRVHDMVLVAIENNWENIEAHKERIRAGVAQVLEDGIRQGVFEPHDPQVVSGLILGAMVRYCHPVLVAQNIDEDLEASVNATVAFLLRSIELKRSPMEPGVSE
ncbi:TetR/AcrR family transcriptional regulator [Xanthobacter variabilis]|uniref:TetR/AcrR family transcriptional regulator n=1 Tax=Xanthobacter variabilis TaxID=3119932 RepID=UPI00374E9971